MTATRYTHTLTIIAPETDWAGANALAGIFGESGEGDLRTFSSANWLREDARYACAETVCTDRIALLIGADAAGISLPQPLWGDVNTVAAKKVLAGALLLRGSIPGTAYAGQTIIALNVPALEVLSAFGFSPAPVG